MLTILKYFSKFDKNLLKNREKVSKSYEIFSTILKTFNLDNSN